MNGLSVWRQLPKKPLALFGSANMSVCKVEVNKTGKPFRISVEGNIGSGKSTFLNYVKNFPFVEVFEEPLDKWTNVQGHNLLNLLYTDMHKWNFTFQSYVQLTRLEIQTKTPSEGVKIQLFERSVQNNRYCFMENSFKGGFLLPEQFAVLTEWYSWIEKNFDISLDLIVYLETSPEVVYKRVKTRNRSEEESVTIDFLRELHESHEQWLNGPSNTIPTCRVNGDNTFGNVIENCRKKLPALFSLENTLNPTEVKGA